MKLFSCTFADGEVRIELPLRGHGEAQGMLTTVDGRSINIFKN